MNKRVDLTAMNVVRAKKGEAAPALGSILSPNRVESTATLHVPPAAEQTQTVSPLAPAPTPSAAFAPRKAKERGEPRSPVTTRLTYGLQDRLFRAATMLGKSQQSLIEEALDAMLRNNGL